MWPSVIRTTPALQAGFRGAILSSYQFGHISTYAIFAPQHVEKSVTVIREELARFQIEGVTADELNNAKKAYAESKKYALMRDSAIMSFCPKIWSSAAT
jgi:predicted Zn-dependent peptidase